MAEITDSMIDRFYGEYERPGSNTDVACECCACEREIGDTEHVIFSENGLVCEDCMNEMFDKAFQELTYREKADILGYILREAHEAVNV